MNSLDTIRLGLKAFPVALDRLGELDSKKQRDSLIGQMRTAVELMTVAYKDIENTISKAWNQSEQQKGFNSMELSEKALKLRREAQKRYRDSHREQLREYQREYRAKNADKISEQHRNWQRKNPEKVSEYKRRYWEKKASEAEE